jgi:hypothetical protein
MSKIPAPEDREQYDNFDITFEVENIGLPDDEEARTDVATNMANVMAIAVREADPGFDANLSGAGTLSPVSIEPAGAAPGDGSQWAETQVGSEGISTTLYATDENGEPVVVDEWWAAWADIFGSDAAWGQVSEATDTIEHTSAVLGSDQSAERTEAEQ